MLEKNTEYILSLHVRKTRLSSTVPTCINLLLGFFFFDCLELDSMFLYDSTDIRKVAKVFKWRRENHRLVWNFHCDLSKWVSVIFLSQHGGTVCAGCCATGNPILCLSVSVQVKYYLINGLDSRPHSQRLDKVILKSAKEI